MSGLNLENATTLSNERQAALQDVARGFFGIIDGQGNSKVSLEQAISALFTDLQTIMLDYADQMSPEHSLRWSADIVLLITVIRVVMNNPMWESEALTLQMRHEFEECLGSAKALEF